MVPCFKFQFPLFNLEYRKATDFYVSCILQPCYNCILVPGGFFVVFFFAFFSLPMFSDFLHRQLHHLWIKTILFFFLIYIPCNSFYCPNVLTRIHSFIVTLICNYLITNNIKHLFICLSFINFYSEVSFQICCLSFNQLFFVWNFGSFKQCFWKAQKYFDKSFIKYVFDVLVIFCPNLLFVFSFF